MRALITINRKTIMNDWSAGIKNFIIDEREKTFNNDFWIDVLTN